jgi:hypothetical protein
MGAVVRLLQDNRSDNRIAAELVPCILLWRVTNPGVSLADWWYHMYVLVYTTNGVHMSQQWQAR